MTIYKISLSDVQADGLARLLAGEEFGAINVDSRVADEIRKQIPKPAIEEPEQFGSIVRATEPHGRRLLWQPDPRAGKHYWQAEDGTFEVWSEFTDIEVLRVGIGEHDATLQKIRDLLFRSPTGYLTNEETLAAYRELRSGLSRLLAGGASS